MKALFCGGCRSGKSHLAQIFAESFAPDRVYLATASSTDPEFSLRILKHQQARGQGWNCYELFAPDFDFQGKDLPDLAEIVKDLSLKNSVILLDSTALWLSAMLFAGFSDEEIGMNVDKLLETINKNNINIIFVHDETGWGLVSEYPLGRRFRDISGESGQKFARTCETVILSVCGLPMCVKGDLPLCLR